MVAISGYVIVGCENKIRARMRGISARYRVLYSLKAGAPFDIEHLEIGNGQAARKMAICGRKTAFLGSFSGGNAVISPRYLGTLVGESALPI
jgi:hypothetical protein